MVALVAERALGLLGAPTAEHGVVATNVSVWPHDDVVPLELWDVVVDGATLFARRDERSFYASLAKAAAMLRRGEALRASGERLPELAWDTVALVGGALDERRARAAFRAADLSVGLVSSDAMFVVHGGLGLARAIHDSAVAVDVGQTAVKAAGAGGSVMRRRPALLATDDGTANVATRGIFCEEVAAALLAASGEAPPSFVLLSLPCEVVAADRGIDLGSSSYPTAGDGAGLVAEILARAGAVAIRVAIVNDAVLAAHVVARAAGGGGESGNSSVSSDSGGARLVLTIGHGVGAALAVR